MRYLNLKIETLTSEAFLGCEPVDRATWLCLLRYCAQQETGGRIVGAAGWGARKWPQLCAVMLDEVKRSCPLWSWQGDDLVVEFYPVEQEAAIKAQREAGRNFGRKPAKPETTIKINWLDKIKTEQPGKTKKAEIASADLEAGFDLLWSIYPRPDGKKPARQAFEKIAKNVKDFPGLLDEMKAAIAWQSQTEQWRGGVKFIPHLSTWLNQERWKDERTARAPQVKKGPLELAQVAPAGESPEKKYNHLADLIRRIAQLEKLQVDHGLDPGGERDLLRFRAARAELEKELEIKQEVLP